MYIAARAVKTPLSSDLATLAVAGRLAARGRGTCLCALPVADAAGDSCLLASIWPAGCFWPASGARLGVGLDPPPYLLLIFLQKKTGVDLGSISGRSGGDLGSHWARSDINLGSLWFHLGPVWCQSGIHLGSIWGPSGVNLGSILCQSGANMVSI